jgi:adenylate cyclase
LVQTVSCTDLDRIELRLWARLLWAGLFYLSVAVATLTIVVEDPRRGSRVAVVISVGLAAAAAVAIVAPLGVLASRRSFRRAVTWMTEGRLPTDHERAVLQRLPARQAALVVVCGAAATPMILGACTLYYPWPQVARMLVGAIVTVGGAWLLALIIAERLLGPVVVSVADPTSAARFGVVGRLCAAWIQGLAVPLACLVIAPERVGLNAVQWLVVTIGLSFSFTAIVATSRSIALPLRELRRTVQTVREGDLTVLTPLDDGGEVGQLQLAVNEMVAGLRERDRLHRLFGRYVGDAVVRRALEDEERLGGEIRDVSALFIDLIGSTTLAEVIPPDEFVIILNEFYDAVVQVVDGELGFVNKFEGDAALCIFGAPGELADHASRALRAARVLRDYLGAVGPDRVGFDVGIGVSSGSVVAGTVGSRSRYEYTIIGGPVNEAARLSELAKSHPARVLASAATIGCGGAEADCWLPDGVVQLRGRSRETRLFMPPTLEQGAGGRRYRLRDLAHV